MGRCERDPHQGSIPRNMNGAKPVRVCLSASGLGKSSRGYVRAFVARAPGMLVRRPRRRLPPVRWITTDVFPDNYWALVMQHDTVTREVEI